MIYHPTEAEEAVPVQWAAGGAVGLLGGGITALAGARRLGGVISLLSLGALGVGYHKGRQICQKLERNFELISPPAAGKTKGGTLKEYLQVYKLYGQVMRAKRRTKHPYLKSFIWSVSKDKNFECVRAAEAHRIGTIDAWTEHRTELMQKLKAETDVETRDLIAMIAHVVLVRQQDLAPLRMTYKNGEGVVHHIIATAWRSPKQVWKNEGLQDALKESQEFYIDEWTNDSKGQGTCSVRNEIAQSVEGAKELNFHGTPSFVYATAEGGIKKVKYAQRVELLEALHAPYRSKTLRRVRSEIEDLGVGDRNVIWDKERYQQLKEKIIPALKGDKLVCIVIDGLKRRDFCKFLESKEIKFKPVQDVYEKTADQVW